MTNFKKLLLTGTAVVAMGAFAPAAFAQADIDVAADGTWASAGTQADDGTIAEAVAGADADVSADATITVTNDTTADDGSVDTNTFALGAVTDSGTATGNIAITTGSANPLAVTIESFDLEGNFTVTGVDANNANINVTITEASRIGGNLVITTDEAAAGTETAVGASAGLTVDGTTTLTSAAGGDAVLVLQGDSEFGGLVTLDDDTGSASVIAESSTTNLTVDGDFDGAGADEGEIIVTDSDATDANTVTFSGIIGGGNALSLVAVGDDLNNQGGSAVFDGNVTADNFAIGATNVSDENVTADFNGDVVANTGITITADTTGGGTGTSEAIAIFGNDVTGDITLVDADVTMDGSVSVVFDGSEAATVTGNIIASDDSVGDVVFENTDVANGGTTVTGTIGAAGDGVGRFIVEEGAAASISDNVVVDSQEAGGLDIDGTFIIDATGGVTIDEESAFAIALDGQVESTGGQLDFGSTGGGEIHAGWNDTSARLRTDNTVALTSDIVVGDSAGDMYTIEYANLAATVDGGGNDLSIADGATLNVAIADDLSLELDGTENITLLQNFTNGGDDIATLVTDEKIVFGNELITGTVVTDANTYTINALDNVDATTLGGFNSASAGVANALLGLTVAESQAGTGELETVRNAIIGAATTAEASALAEAAGANVAGGNELGAVSTVTNSALGITGERLASLRSGNETGMAAGNMTHGLKVWGKVFGTTGEQDDRDGITGYDVDTYGVTVGVDTQTLAEDWVWGLAFTYADTEVDRDIGANNTETELDTYQISVYGDYKWDAATYINGQLGYAMNDGDQRREFGALVANADADSDVFFARLETGRDYDMDNGFTLTPIAMLNYQHINPDDYTETGTCGAACLTVDTDSMNILEAGLGAEASYLMQNADGSFLKPKLHAAYRYDFIGDEVEATSSFAGAPGAAFNTEGFDAQQNTFNIGAGLEFFSTSNWEMSVNYDYEIKEDYDGHNGYVRAAYKF